jgi:hypothetical protein
MERDREDRTGQVPLPGFSDPAPSGRPAPTRADGIRHVRRTSNWTLAALIVGTGAATVALAHNAFPTAVTAAGTASTTTGAGGAATAQGASGPQVNHSVATTSGSAVVVTTTTHTANGKVIVTHVRHSTYHDS